MTSIVSPHAGRFQLFRAYRQGLKDARLGEPDEDGAMPWNHRVHGQCGELEAAMSDRLYESLRSIDGRIDSIAREALDLLDRKKASEPERVTDAGSSVGTAVASVRNNQILRAHTASVKQAESALAAAGSEVAQLLSDRHHEIEKARADLRAVIAYFDALAGAHRLGMERRGTTLIGRLRFNRARRMKAKMPAYTPYSAWYAKDVPIVVPGTRERIEVLEWHWRTFEGDPA